MPTPWSQDEVRAFALSLPETHEHSHFDRPDIRVRNKIFVTLPPDGRTAIFKTTPLGLDMLLRSGTETYFDAWGGRWVGAILENADPVELLELTLESYCITAPKSLAVMARASVQNL